MEKKTAHSFDDIFGKKVLITGGSKGIGKEIAIEFAKLGSDVIITGRSEKDLEETTRLLKKYSSSCDYLVGDMQDVNSVYSVVDSTVSRLGKIDILINNAGVNITKPSLEVTEEDWDQVLDTNLKGTFFAHKELGKI